MRQSRYPQGGSQNIHKEAVSYPCGEITVKSSTRRQLNSSQGGKYDRSVIPINYETQSMEQEHTNDVEHSGVG